MLTRQGVEKQQYPSESSFERNRGILYDSTNNINNIKSLINTTYRPYHRPVTDTSPIMHPPPMTMASSQLNNHKKNDLPRSGMCDGGSSDNGSRNTVGVYRRNSMGGTFYGSQHHRPPPPPPPPPPPRSFGAPPLNAGYAQRRFSCSSIGIERLAHSGVSSHPPATSKPQAAHHCIGGGTNNANKNNHRSDGVGSHSFLNSHAPAPAPASGSSFESASISSGGGYDDHHGSKCSSPYGNNIQVHSYRPQSKISSQRHSADQNDSPANRTTSNNPYHKPTKSSLTNNLISLLSTLLFLTLVTLFPVTLNYRHTYNSLQQQLELAGNVNHRRPHAKQQIHGTTQQQNELSSLQNEVAALTTRRDHLKSQYQKFTNQMQSKIDVAERERESLEHEIEVHNIALAHSQEEMEKFKAMALGRKKLESFVIKREEVLWEKIDGLKEMVAKFSHREGVDWFGEGPHRVEITLEYPQYTPGQDISTWPRTTKPFIVELAPLSIMPHTVTFFLSQVYHKLWDGIRLYHNLEHIYHFAPSSNINESGVDTPSSEYQRFRDRKLDKVIFQEYHHEYPHEAWTLGFSGRPGGTEFYINKLNNSFSHGPGGQTDDVYSDADPCFGKVVDGRAVFGEIDKIPENSLMQGVVVIQSIRPLFAEKNPVDEWLKKKMGTLGVGRDGLLRWLSR